MLEIRASAQHFLGMPVDEFLRGYWQKKPLLIRQAFPGYVAPLAPEDLAGLACEESALSRLVQHDRKNDRWTVRTGPFQEEEFPGLGHRDWTLLVQDMDKWDADVRALLDRFRFLPAWRIDDVMISFATPGGSVGAHVDNYDVFLLQAMGQRRWQIDADPEAPREFRDDAEIKLLRRFTASHEWVLEPGDMLYLPPGVPHNGEAVDACMTFSVGMRAPSRAELLVDLAEELAAALPEEARYADPDLAEPRDAFEIDEAAFARADQALSAWSELDAKSRRRWFGRFITRYRSAGEIAPGPKPPTLAGAEKSLSGGGLLLRHPFARSAWSREGRTALLFVDGEAWQMDARSAHVLASYEAIDDAALAKLGAAGRDALATLLRRGHYQLQRTGEESEMNTIPDAGFRVEPADYQVDFQDLRSVREPVFVQEQKVPVELEWDEIDPLCRHVIARDDEHRPIGTGRLTPERKIGRMAVLPEWRGRGVGEALLRALVEQARDLGLPEVALHAQVDAIGFYEKFGFEAYGERFEEAGIQHQSMRLALPPREIERRHSPRVRGPSQQATDIEGLDATREAVLTLVATARRDIMVYTRDLEPALFAHPPIVQAFKEFAISGRGGTVRFVVQDPTQAQHTPHPLIAVAQRLSSAFLLRAPQDVEELQYPSVFVANDADGYLFRLLGSRFEGDWSPALPGRNRQIQEHFQRVWERARPCTELRSLQI